MKKAKIDNPLLDRVNFVRRVQTGKGPETASHCIVRYGRIVASFGMLAAGAPVAEDDLDCCPHTGLLAAALEQCQGAHAITQDDSGLAIRSQGLLGEFQALVPTCERERLTLPVPDPPLAPLGDAFKHAVATVGSLAKDKARTLLESCIQLDNGSAIATNGFVILQAWHGFGMPSGLLVPKSFVEVLAKIKLPIKAFGASSPSMPGPSTFTVHFEGDFWLRTLLHCDRIPDMPSKLLESESSFTLPANFFSCVEAVAKWSADERIYVYNDSLCSQADYGDTGAGYAIAMPGMRQGVSYRISDLLAISKQAKRIDSNHRSLTMFYGDNLRGAIAHKLTDEPEPRDYYKELEQYEYDASCYEDDIPF